MRTMPAKYKQPSIIYPGGKSKVAKQIIAKMPPHEVYVEPFAGAAHVFFQKPKAPKNILNDKNRELIKFFQGIKGKKICCSLSGGQPKFESIRNKTNKSLCDRVFLNKNSYGGKHTFTGRPTYGYLPSERLNRSLCFDGEKLKGVTLTSKDFKDTI